MKKLCKAWLYGFLHKLADATLIAALYSKCSIRSEDL